MLGIRQATVRVPLVQELEHACLRRQLPTPPPVIAALVGASGAAPSGVTDLRSIPIFQCWEVARATVRKTLIIGEKTRRASRHVRTWNNTGQTESAENPATFCAKAMRGEKCRSIEGGSFEQFLGRDVPAKRPAPAGTRIEGTIVSIAPLPPR